MSGKVVAVDDYGNLTSSSDVQRGFQMVNKGARTSLLKQDSQSAKQSQAKSFKTKMSLANLLENEDAEEENKIVKDIDKTSSIDSIIHELLFPGNDIISCIMSYK